MATIWLTIASPTTEAVVNPCLQPATTTSCRMKFIYSRILVLIM